MRMTKETDGIESDDRERGRKDEYSEKKDEERRLRGWRAIQRKPNGEKNNRKRDMQDGDSREGGRDSRTGEDRSRCDRRKDEGKKGSESRCDQTDVNNRDDDRKKRDGKERNNRESGSGKVKDQVDVNRRSYSEAVIEGALRTEKVFKGNSILKKTDKILSKGEDVACCCCLSSGARIEHMTERVENILGHG